MFMSNKPHDANGRQSVLIDPGIQIWILFRCIPDSNAIFRAYLPFRDNESRDLLFIDLVLWNSNYYRYPSACFVGFENSPADPSRTIGSSSLVKSMQIRMARVYLDRECIKVVCVGRGQFWECLDKVVETYWHHTRTILEETRVICENTANLHV